MKDLTKAKDILRSDGYTCVMCKGNSLSTSTRRGVAPLVAWFESGKNYKDFCAADKVIGKATAFIYVLLGVKAVYALVISKSALQVLIEHGIEVEYGNLVENIINRNGDGICPFESAVLDVVDPMVAYKIVRKKMSEMNITIEGS